MSQMPVLWFRVLYSIDTFDFSVIYDTVIIFFLFSHRILICFDNDVGKIDTINRCQQHTFCSLFWFSNQIITLFTHLKPAQLFIQSNMLFPLYGSPNKIHHLMN